MLGKLVVATALTLICRFVHTSAWYEDQFDFQYIGKLFHEDDMTPEFIEQLDRHDHTSDEIRRTVEDKYGPPQVEVKTTTRSAIEKRSHNVSVGSPKVIVIKRVHRGNTSADGKKTSRNIGYEDTDIADREDHVTQYLADDMVNTDNEITFLQAHEPEDDPGERASNEIKGDNFFAFLTGLEEIVEGISSRPFTDVHMDILMVGNRRGNAIIDEEYKD